MSHVELAVLDEIPLAHQIICQQRELGNRVGLVPTMGALHEGHLSLVEAARRQSDFVVVTIFVNPTQFAAGEDLDRYPRTMEGDLELLRRKDVDLVFAPTVDQMYPSGCTTSVRAPEVATTLEGEHRPEHFEGVATVVLKLFQILPAHCAYFGLKDYQQCLVVRDMVRDLNVPIDLTFCPIIREDDGLAKSSRNRYLTPQERESATRLYGALQHARHLYKSGQNHPEKTRTRGNRFPTTSGRTDRLCGDSTCRQSGKNAAGHVGIDSADGRASWLDASDRQWPARRTEGITRMILAKG